MLFRSITAVSPFTALSPDKVTFDPADIQPERTLRFHQIVESLRNSGWSPAQLKYIFSDQSEASASLIPPPDSVDALLASIREGLVAIAAEHVATNDATGELTKARLSLIMDEPTAQQLAAVIGGKQPCSVPLPLLPAGVVLPVALPVASGVVVYDDKNRRLQANGWLSEAEKTA